MRFTLLPLPLLLLAGCSDERGPHASDASMPTSPKTLDSTTETAHQAEVRDAIAKDATLSAAAKSVTVKTFAGRVTLSGKVPTEAERKRVEELARGCASTREVENSIEVERP